MIASQAMLFIAPSASAKLRIIGYLWSALCLQLSISALAVAESNIITPYCVEGLFTYDIRKPSGEHYVKNQSFRVAVTGESWEIAVIRDESTNSRVYLYRFDGTNILYSVAGPRSTQTFGGLVEASPVPFLWGGGGAFAWLAYASGPYFITRASQSALSLHEARSATDIVKRYDVRATWSLHPESPHLPMLVTYMTTNTTSLDASGAFRYGPLLPPFQDGYTNEEFRARDFTNAAGVWLPLRFGFRAYFPRPNAKSSRDLDCILHVDGWATNITLAEAHLPAAKRAIVQDVRLPEPAVLYPVTNGIIQDTGSSVVVAARHLAARKTRLASARKHPRWLWAVRVVLVIGGLGLPIFWFARSKRV